VRQAALLEGFGELLPAAPLGVLAALPLEPGTDLVAGA
jgi:hypothetical protein